MGSDGDLSIIILNYFQVGTKPRQWRVWYQTFITCQSVSQSASLATQGGSIVFPLTSLAWPGWQCLLGQRDFNESWGDISGLLAGQRTTKLGFWQIGIGIYVFIILCDDGFMTFLFFNLSQSEWRNNIWITFTFRSPVVTQSLFYPGLCILQSPLSSRYIITDIVLIIPDMLEVV